MRYRYGDDQFGNHATANYRWGRCRARLRAVGVDGFEWVAGHVCRIPSSQLIHAPSSQQHRSTMKMVCGVLFLKAVLTCSLLPMRPRLAHSRWRELGRGQCGDNLFDRLKQCASSASQQKNKYMGICGQGASGHADFAQRLAEKGIASILLNPDRVTET